MSNNLFCILITISILFSQCVDSRERKSVCDLKGENCEPFPEAPIDTSKCTISDDLSADEFRKMVC